MKIFKNEANLEHIKIMNDHIYRADQIQMQLVEKDIKYLRDNHESQLILGLGTMISLFMTHNSAYYKYDELNLLEEWRDNYNRFLHILNKTIVINPSHYGFEHV